MSFIVHTENPTDRKFNLVTTSAAGSIPHRVYAGSVFNAGSANGTLNGVTIPPGVSIPINPGNGRSNAEITYDGTGTTLIIQYWT